MSGYIGTQPVPQATQHRETFTATASQTTFATVGYTPQFVDVYLNGVHLLDGTDFTASNSSDIVLTAGASAGDVVEVISFETFEVASQTFTGTTSVDVLTATGAFTSVGIDDNATSTAVTIDASENVGIGAATVDSALHIEKSTPRITLQLAGNSGYSTIESGGVNELIFGRSGTEHMRIDASGQVTTPYQPAFNAYSPAKTAISTMILWGITRSNVGNHYSTATGLFTAPVAGHYSFHFNCLMGNPYTGTHVRLWFKINGTANAAYGDTLADKGGNISYTSPSMSINIHLSANDTVGVYNEGPIETYGTAYGTFSGFLIG